jgi:hypothetical protein
LRTSRLEAFSDAVMAIIITIMVLGLKVPSGHDLSSLIHTTGTGLLTYLLSFVYVGIYWNNHHHMFHLVRRVSGGVLWANLAMLFSEGPDSPLRRALGNDLKGRVSPFLYVAGILSALFIDPAGRIGVWFGLGFFVAVAVLWVVPDRRIDRIVHEHENLG